jgi:hypothetical protein
MIDEELNTVKQQIFGLIRRHHVGLVIFATVYLD